MTFDTAKEIVDKYLAILAAHGKAVAEVNFGGGEPLLAWNVIHKVLEYCTTAYGDRFRFVFSINTNGSLITEPVAAALTQYGVHVAISLDGLKEANDKVRVTNAGKGTFDLILRGFRSLEAVGNPTDGFAVTLNERNFDQLDESLIDWAASRGMSEVRIDIDVIDMLDVPLDTIVSRLMRVRRYAKSLNIDIAGFWARPFEGMNTSPLVDQVGFCGAVKSV